MPTLLRVIVLSTLFGSFWSGDPSAGTPLQRDVSSFAFPQQEDEKEESRRFARVIYNPYKLKIISRDRVREVQEIYDNFRRSAGSPDAHMPMEVMQRIFRAGGFDVVKSLIEDGKISEKHSYDLADLRTVLALESA